MDATSALSRSQTLASWPADSYDFDSPLDVGALENGSLSSDLVATHAFRRLADIRFLGAIDYRCVPVPNGSPSATRYTRWQHSLGVLALVLRYCEERHVAARDRNVMCAAALLHDIGHPPLSHSMEPVFEEHFGVNHQRATQDIIYGRAPVGREVPRVLRSHNVDVDRVASLVAQENSEFDCFFSGPITFDTIEGISRSYAYVKRTPAAPRPMAIMLAATHRETGHERIVDDFWKCKDMMYSLFINSSEGIAADYASQRFLRQHLGRIKIADYYGTESRIFHKLTGLKCLLESPLAAERGGLPDSYVRRRYFIDPTGDFYSREDPRRYRYTKERCELTWHSPPPPPRPAMTAKLI